MLATEPAGPTERAEDVTSLVPAGVHPRPALNYRFAVAGRNHRGANTGLGDPLGIAIKAAPAAPGAVSAAVLSTIGPPGATSTTATAINDHGAVAGFFSEANGNILSFIKQGPTWTALSVPGSPTT